MAASKPNAHKEETDRIDALLDEPYWVVDLLPAQVPADSAGQFFQVERLFLEGSRHQELRRKFADVVLKLYCYHDFLVFRGEKPAGKQNPKPKKLEQWVLRNEPLNILLPAEDALLAIPSDSTCMTLYHPTPDLLEQVRQLTAACSLFVWQPPA